MFIIHVNESMTLRMLTARDAKKLSEIIEQSRDDLRKWLPWLNDIKTADDALSFIKNSFQVYNNRKGITAGIFLHDELVGIISFNTLDFHHKIGQIGYWLAKNYQGKGIMITAVSELLTYGFTELALNRIEIRVASENQPSRALAEKLKFVNEGRIRQAEWLYDHYVDHIIYGMLRDEWHVH